MLREFIYTPRGQASADFIFRFRQISSSVSILAQVIPECAVELVTDCVRLWLRLSLLGSAIGFVCGSVVRKIESVQRRAPNSAKGPVPVGSMEVVRTVFWLSDDLERMATSIIE